MAAPARAAPAARRGVAPGGPGNRALGVGRGGVVGSSRRVVRLGLVALMVAAAADGCSRAPISDSTPAAIPRGDGRIEVPDRSPLRTALAFDTARTVELSDLVVATATVESDPARTVRVFPPLAGRVISVSVRLGDPVRVGQPLLTLDAPDFAAAQADLTHAQAAYRQASRALARERDLAAYGIAAQRDVEQAETDFTQAAGDLRRAAAHLRLLGIDTAAALHDTALVIRSPVSGRVTDLSAGVGEFHSDPTVSVLTVADLGTVWLTANLPEKDLHDVAIGDRATAVLSAYPTDTLRGVVATIGAVVDTGTRMTKVRVMLPNRGERLKPGMYATVTFAGRAAPRVVVPASSLLQLRDSNYVFVETMPWTLERRAVTLGPAVAGGVIVRAGLAGGQRIVSRQVVLLQ